MDEQDTVPVLWNLNSVGGDRKVNTQINIGLSDSMFRKENKARPKTKKGKLSNFLDRMVRKVALRKGHLSKGKIWKGEHYVTI